MSGWVVVSPKGHESDYELSQWVDKGIALAMSLPPKAGYIEKTV